MVGGVDALACLDHGIVCLNVDVGGRNNELFARDRRRGGDGIVFGIGGQQFAAAKALAARLIFFPFMIDNERSL